MNEASGVWAFYLIIYNISTTADILPSPQSPTSRFRIYGRPGRKNCRRERLVIVEAQTFWRARVCL